MFCDIVGSTELSSRLDPEDLNALIRAYQGRVAESISQFGGFIARYMGDSVLAYFGWPKASETDAEQAVRAALTAAEAVAGSPIQGEAVRMRIGIASGLVVIGDPIGVGDSRQQTAIGETPNRAARLQALASPGTIVIDNATLNQVGNLFRCRELGAVLLKGLPEPVLAFEVLAEQAGQSRFEALHATGLPPLIGRAEELQLLQTRWAEAAAGEGRVVLVSGEPGIGKSRLLAELDERLKQEPLTRVRYFCSPHYQGTAFHPIIRQFEFAAGLDRSEPASQQLGRLEALLARSHASGEAVALIADLLAVPSNKQRSLANLSPQRRKEKLLAAVLAQLEDLSRQHPLLVIFEDVHWIDPTSLELLALLVERAPCFGLLLVITGRPEFSPPWPDSQATAIELGPLSRGELVLVIDRMTSGKSLPDEISDQILSRTEGVPLFLEELTKTVLEGEFLNEQPDRYVLARPLPPLAIPTTLHGSLMARLDRLPDAKRVAQTAAVIGREFAYELLAAVAETTETDLRRGLDQLIGAGLVFRRHRGADAVYLFNHALVQDAAYASLLRSTRSGIHARVVRALLALTPGVEESQPELIAQHCAQAGLLTEAADYYCRAGQQSIARSATKEARSHLESGLALTAGLPDTPERRRIEAGLQAALGSVWIVTKGYGSQETANSILRAVELARSVGQTPLLIRALFGEFTLKVHRGDLVGSFPVVHEMIRLGDSQNDATIRFVAASSLGLCHAFAGHFLDAKRELERCLAERAGDDAVATMVPLAQDPEVLARSFLSLPLAAIGLLDRSIDETQMSIARARQLQNQPSLAVALAIGCRQAWLTRDLTNVRQRAAELVAVCELHGYPYWLARGRCYAGAMAIIDGDDASGRSLLDEGLRVLHEFRRSAVDHSQHDCRSVCAFGGYRGFAPRHRRRSRPHEPDR